jgi:hypothetical protein
MDSPQNYIPLDALTPSRRHQLIIQMKANSGLQEHELNVLELAYTYSVRHRRHLLGSGSSLCGTNKNVGGARS